MERRAVFLDRDGVLNRSILKNGKPHPPRNASELEILPGVVESCRELREAGFLLVVVTNQPDVARRTQQREAVEAMNGVIYEKTSVDDICVCYHDDRDLCFCRKPAPGLLLQAAEKWKIDLPSSFMVGDRWRDVKAGRRAGCRTILVRYPYLEEQQSVPDHEVRSLAEATDWILRQVRT